MTWTSERRHLPVLPVVAVLLAAVAVFVVVPGAVAAATTTCSASSPLAGPVPGDLLVPAGEHCDLSYDVAGSAVVQSGGSLSSDGAGITRNLRLERGAGAEFDHGSGVGGYAVLDHARGLSMSHTFVGGALIGSLDSGGGLDFDVSGVGGRLAITGTGSGASVRAYGLEVDSDAVVSGVRVALQDGVSIYGRLALSQIADGPAITSPYQVRFTDSVVCGGHVRDNVTVDDSPGRVELGAGAVCAANEFPLTVDGAFLARRNTGHIVIGGHIGGAAVCRDNTHHPRGDALADADTALTVEGNRLGQCSRLPAP